MQRSKTMMASTVTAGGCALNTDGALGTETQQAELSQKVDALMLSRIDPEGPGGAVGVIYKGRFIHKKSYGLAELETKTPFTVTTPSYLCSVSKQFTTMAVMILKEEGKLAYQDKLRAFHPELPAEWDAITIRHLMTNTSGLTDIFQIAGQPDRMTNALALQKIIEHRTLDFEPGARYSYSNSGFIMLALVVEKASGIALADFIRTRIFTPLGMKDSYVFQQDLKIPGRAIGYQKNGAAWTRFDYNLLTVGAGGLYSTVEDMAKWDQALYGNQLVGQATLQEAFTQQAQVNASNGYGYGWKISTVHGRRRIEHDGSLRAFMTAIVRLPETEFTLIMLTNAGWSRTQRNEMRDALVRIYFPDPRAD